MANFIKIETDRYFNLDNIIEISRESKDGVSYTYVRCSDGTSSIFEDREGSGSVWCWWDF